MKPVTYSRIGMGISADRLAVMAGAASGPGALLAEALAAGRPLFESGALAAQCGFRVRNHVHAFSLGGLGQTGRAFQDARHPHLTSRH